MSVVFVSSSPVDGIHAVETPTAHSQHPDYGRRRPTDLYDTQQVNDNPTTMAPRIDVQPPTRIKKNTPVYPSVVVSSDVRFDGLWVAAVDSAGRALGEILLHTESVAPEFLANSTGGSSSDGRWYTAITSLEITQTGPVKLYIVSFTNDEAGNITYGWNLTTRRIEVERRDVATQLGTAAEQAVLERLRQYGWFGVPELAAPSAPTNGGSSSSHRRRR